MGYIWLIWWRRKRRDFVSTSWIYIFFRQKVLQNDFCWLFTFLTFTNSRSPAYQFALHTHFSSLVENQFITSLKLLACQRFQNPYFFTKIGKTWRHSDSIFGRTVRANEFLLCQDIANCSSCRCWKFGDDIFVTSGDIAGKQVKKPSVGTELTSQPYRVTPPAVPFDLDSACRAGTVDPCSASCPRTGSSWSPSSRRRCCWCPVWAPPELDTFGCRTSALPLSRWPFHTYWGGREVDFQRCLTNPGKSAASKRLASPWCL